MFRMLVQLLFPHKWVSLGLLVILLGIGLLMLMTINLVAPSLGLCFLAFMLIIGGSVTSLLSCCFYLGNTALEG